MSSFIKRGKYDYIGARGTSDKFSFHDIVTKPESVASIFRQITGSNFYRLRAYNMYRMFTNVSTSKLDYATLGTQYSQIVTSIFNDFVDSYGKYIPTVGINVYSEIRVKLIRHISSITGTKNVNVIFKTTNANAIFDEKISMYINPGMTSIQRCGFSQKFDAVSVVLPKDSSVTVLIPMKYIEKTINGAYGIVMNEISTSGEREATNQKIRSNVLSRLDDVVSVDLLNSVVSAAYQASVFYNGFAMSVIGAAKELIMSTNVKATTPKEYLGSTTKPDITFIKNIIDNTMDSLHPMIVMDMFEIGNNELAMFVSNFVGGDNLGRNVQNPRMSNLRNDYLQYNDDESRISASVAYISRLNYVVMMLMMFGKNTITESTRSTYCKDVISALQSVKSQMKTSIVTGSKAAIISEIEYQISMIQSLSSDIVKLKSYYYV